MICVVFAGRMNISARRVIFLLCTLDMPTRLYLIWNTDLDRSRATLSFSCSSICFTHSFWAVASVVGGISVSVH